MSWVWDVKTDVIWVWNVKKEVQVWKWDVKKGNEILMKEYFTCCYAFFTCSNIVRIFTHTQWFYYVNLFSLKCTNIETWFYCLMSQFYGTVQRIKELQNFLGIRCQCLEWKQAHAHFMKKSAVFMVFHEMGKFTVCYA